MTRLILTILFLVFISSVYSQTKNFIDQPYLEVVGEADTLITPNQIFIKIIIAERDNKDKISMEDQEKKMLNAFKSLNINYETDLSTSDILSNYRFYLLKQKDVLKTKEYILKVADAATASKVFIALEDIGLSNANIDHVNHTNLRNIANACKAKAIKDAQTKAMAMTKPLNQSIGNAIHITENDPSTLMAQPGSGTRIMVRGINSYNSGEDKFKYEAPKIDFEKIKVSSSINVAFILK